MNTWSGNYCGSNVRVFSTDVNVGDIIKVFVKNVHVSTKVVTRIVNVTYKTTLCEVE